LAEAAPFDAILVAAGGPDVPMALERQLTIGGRLVIPVGSAEGGQTLLKITRTADDMFEEENLGSVVFVPLVGEQGWAEDGRRAATNHVPGRARALPQMIADAAEPLPDFNDSAFGRLFDRFADRRVVLLGEASHGTAEFYRARAAITRHLIENRASRSSPSRRIGPTLPPSIATSDLALPGLAPNRRSSAFHLDVAQHRGRRLHRLAARLQLTVTRPDRRVGFHGLDIYNMSGSIAAVLAYLDKIDPQAAQIARERYGCLTPWQNEPSTYGRAVLSGGYRKCEDAVITQCRELLQQRLKYAAGDGESFLDAAQNARLVAAAERYYRIMYYGGAASWNLRDTHMFETLGHLLEARGPQSRLWRGRTTPISAMRVSPIWARSARN